MARNYSRLDSKKSSLGAREPTEDVKPTRVDPRLPERMIHTSYDRSKRYGSALTSSQPRDHDNSTTSKRSGVRLNVTNNSRANIHLLNEH
jgi:hypothetical protein